LNHYLNKLRSLQILIKML